MAEEKKWTEDDFGVVTWGSYKRGETLVVGGHDPFVQMLETLNSDLASSVPDTFKRAAILVHDDMDVARSIAISLFGKHWRDHVMDVYDRLRLRESSVKEGE